MDTGVPDYIAEHVAQVAAMKAEMLSEHEFCKRHDIGNPMLGIDQSANGTLTGYGWMRARGD